MQWVNWPAGPYLVQLVLSGRELRATKVALTAIRSVESSVDEVEVEAQQRCDMSQRARVNETRRGGTRVAVKGDASVR